MPRKIRRTGPPALPPGGIKVSLAVCIAAALFCLALGVGGTYLALKPALAQAAVGNKAAAQAARELGNRQEDQGQWKDAIVSYQQAIAAGIDNPDLRTDLGVAYFKSSQPQKALEQYVLAQKLDPNHENSLFNEASAYAVLGDSKQAIAIWNSYLQKFPAGQHVADARSFIAEVKAHGLSPVPPGKTPE